MNDIVIKHQSTNDLKIKLIRSLYKFGRDLNLDVKKEIIARSIISITYMIDNEPIQILTEEMTFELFEKHIKAMNNYVINTSDVNEVEPIVVVYCQNGHESLMTIKQYIMNIIVCQNKRAPNDYYLVCNVCGSINRLENDIDILKEIYND